MKRPRENPEKPAHVNICVAVLVPQVNIPSQSEEPATHIHTSISQYSNRSAHMEFKSGAAQLIQIIKLFKPFKIKFFAL